MALQPLAAIGFTPLEAAVVGMGRFPIAGFASWTDDWLEPRWGSDGSFHFHMGIDLAADCGIPLRSPVDGTLEQGWDAGGGYTVEVVMPDGTYLYLAHLSAYVAGETSGQRVQTGDAIGFIGETGDATGCHLHFEIHPKGGAAIDAKPYLDRWVADAIARAPALISWERHLRGLPDLSPRSPAVAAPPTTTTTVQLPTRRDALLFATATNPSGGALALAEADASRAVAAAGPVEVVAHAQATVLAWTEAELAAKAMLRSTTPPVLQPFLGMR